MTTDIPPIKCSKCDLPEFSGNTEDYYSEEELILLFKQARILGIELYRENTIFDVESLVKQKMLDAGWGTKEVFGDAKSCRTF